MTVFRSCLAFFVLSYVSNCLLQVCLLVFVRRSRAEVCLLVAQQHAHVAPCLCFFYFSVGLCLDYSALVMVPAVDESLKVTGCLA